jgi:hypothetical protein
VADDEPAALAAVTDEDRLSAKVAEETRTVVAVDVTSLATRIALLAVSPT